MMNLDIATLTRLLTRPEAEPPLNDTQWSRVIATARNTNTLGKLAARLEASSCLPSGHPSRHLTGALMLSRRQRQSVIWESVQIDEALSDLGVPVVLLKGAAYAMAGHESANGRLFGDVDILVPRTSLSRVEMHLMLKGWASMKQDAYDQRYYREWMHEIPPMMHIRRGTVVDVHHTILPLTARYRPDPTRILERATLLPKYRCLMTPSPEDLIVHSCCHLIHEGEVDNALRDMHDIQCLLKKASASDDFHLRLAEAASEHELTEPLALALKLVNAYFSVPHIAEQLDALGAQRWEREHQKLIRRYLHAIQPGIDGALPFTTTIARQQIYLRAHRLRMPTPLLVRHLSRKAWLSLIGPSHARSEAT